MSFWPWKVGLTGLVTLATTTYAIAQMPNASGMQTGPLGSGDRPIMSRDSMHDRILQGHHGSQGEVDHHEMMTGQEIIAQPTRAGQEAFGTIQEIIQILEADPNTDWSKVNIARLREHLIDMNEVTLNAAAREQALDNGVAIAVTGQGRTLDAIRRMVPAHVFELNRSGWSARTEDLPNGVRLIVTSNDVKQVIKLKALGFMGIMAQGSHHQRHHLLMAKGEFMH